MRQIQLFICIAFLSCVEHVSATSVTDVLQKVNAVYSGREQVYYNCTYNLFKGTTNGELFTKSEGVFVKNKSLIYQKFADAEYLKLDDYTIQVAYEDKVITLDRKDESPKSNLDLSVLDAYLKQATLVENESTYTIKFNFGKVSDSPFSYVELVIEKNTYFLKSVDMYYVHLQNFSETAGTKELAQPHIQILFEETTLSSKKQNDFLKSNRFLVKNDSGSYQPSELFLGYTIIDNRQNN